MRVLVALTIAALALAGCTAPEEAQSPLFGVCPQWLDGDAIAEPLETGGNATFAADPTFSHGGGNRSLDRFHLHLDAIETDGVVELRAFAESDGRPLRFTDYRDPDAVRTPTFLALDGSTDAVEVDVYLSDLTHGAAADPSDLRLELIGVDGATGSMQVTATPGYRVCGVPV